MRSTMSLAVLMVASLGFSQSSLVSNHFRGPSGLPGSGFGVKADGSLGNDGALTFSTPIAYSLKGGDGVFTFGSMRTSTRNLFGGNNGPITNANDNASVLLGYSLPGFNVTFGGMILSQSLDTALNIHVSPTSEVFGLRFGFGVQDALGNTVNYGSVAGSAPDQTRSYYGVVTKELPFLNAYLSVGGGSNRFENGFGSLSFSVIKGLRTYVEYDGEWTGFGAAYQVGQATFSAGLVDNKYPTYSVDLKF